jgi:drug/metabolite transporter (DMT)-like permease
MQKTGIAIFWQKNRTMILADTSLVLVALVWGANFVIMKDALQHITPFAYLGLRFSLGTIILAAIFWRKMLCINKDHLKWGLLAGFLLFTGFAFQTIGLLHTTPAKSGFITGTAVVIVPFFYYLVTKDHPGRFAIAGGFLALAGLYFLSSNGSSSTEGFFLQFGDLLTFVSAFFFAAHIVTLGIMTAGRDTLTLSVIQLAVTGFCSTLMAVAFEPLANLVVRSPAIWAAILYAVIFCTIGAFVAQTAAQKHTHSTHAALILSSEAAFAGIFSFFFWGEAFTLPMFFGIFLIFTGIVITVLKPDLKSLKMGTARFYRQR